PLRLPDGSTIHLDFGWPERMVGLEVDHPAWHDGAEERHRDMDRDRKATIQGWAVPRLSKKDVEERLAAALADVAAILAGRPPMLAPTGTKA
ncbi:MAG: hypothetical protein RJA49_2683, partial [Actinomycetota bacterium]